MLRLQQLEFADCEAAIERAYFDWGSEWTKGVQHPDWTAATPDVRRRIALRGYNLYDGFPVQVGNEIGLFEIYASVGINSGVIANDVVRFLARANKARPLLAMIPDDARLEAGTDEQITAAAKLIELFSEASWIGRGKTTKVLYKKRPAFVPIIDSVVGDFLRKNFPYRLREVSPITDVLHFYRELLVARSQPLEHIKANLRKQGFLLSRSRVLNFLIWQGWRDRVDKFGVGPPIRKVWGALNLPDARSKACEMWEAQNCESQQ
jgi:hypothetical protein